MESPTFWLVLTRWAIINGTAPASSLSPRHLRVTFVSSRSDSNRPKFVINEIPDQRSEEEGDKPGYSSEVETLTTDTCVDCLKSRIRSFK